MLCTDNIRSLKNNIIYLAVLRFAPSNVIFPLLIPSSESWPLVYTLTVGMRAA